MVMLMEDWVLEVVSESVFTKGEGRVEWCECECESLSPFNCFSWPACADQVDISGPAVSITLPHERPSLFVMPF